MFKSFTKLFNQDKENKTSNSNDDKIMLFGGLLVEAALIDGIIDEKEIKKITKSIAYFFALKYETANIIVNECLKNSNENNSFHYYTSRINKEFEYDKKINLLEMLWEVILTDKKIHDFEANLMRRVSGLLYISDIDSGNAKKRILKNINKT